ncbi:hypothetical protein [Lentilactobacillus kosonis]|uniref:Tetrapyrrole biosynthesis uroporphyrinogen III synthase domain-containing protein n=1 Tax=Lentilactobacillus kosonis TaxID=2810561 RepID=A0A401FMR8_9LACO|nr:hypothetical protein [Lentilactobacillus kosonis]GAY73633.1 hypothetical protein NBRC111893_1779 [Lentilactobacillus kosonis]
MAKDADEMKIIASLKANNLLKTTVFLRGNKSLIDDSDININQVIVYRNEWSRADRLAVMKQLGTRDYQKILVTSPSNFRRLIGTDLSFINSAEYYTLGKATQKVIKDVLGSNAYCAKGSKRLEDAIYKIYDDSL